MRTGQFSAVRREADGSRTRAGSVPYEREVSAPAPTLTGMARGWKVIGEDAYGRPLPGWVAERPAPTVTGTRGGGLHAPAAPSKTELQPVEAAALQTFAEGYPWQGTRTAVFQQIGNAVPPVMGEHALREATIG